MRKSSVLGKCALLLILCLTLAACMAEPLLPVSIADNSESVEYTAWQYDVVGKPLLNGSAAYYVRLNHPDLYEYVVYNTSYKNESSAGALDDESRQRLAENYCDLATSLGIHLTVEEILEMDFLITKLA